MAVALVACAGARSAARPHSGAPSARAERPATAAFRAHAAKVLQVPPGEIDGAAPDASSARAGQHTRGGAWQVVMWHRGDMAKNPVCGWVTADGTVITADQNLGILFAEAGVWATPPSHPPDELAHLLADDIVWSYSLGVDLVTMRVGGMGPPELRLGPDGSGTLQFFSNDHGGGAGRSGGGGAPPDVYWKNTVLLTAAHKASLTRTQFKLRADD
jgi:hypothetical protein